jgi:predicted PurR-regulated permease PerM
MASPSTPAKSPKWGSTAKLVVALSYFVIIAALIIYSRNFIGPLLLSFILIYLLHPVIKSISRVTHLSWRIIVNLIFLILIIIFVSTATLAGLAIVQQIQNLIQIVQRFITTLPGLIADLSTRTYTIGPFLLDFSKFDLGTLSGQVLSYVQPLLGRIGDLASTFATSAAAVIGWVFFVLVIAYFVLADAERFQGGLPNFEVPGYDTDIQHLGVELRRIWNAFLRNQLVIFVLIVLMWMVLTTILGIRYSFALAILAGFGRFVPYLGPAITWTVVALVAFFQGGNYFNLPPLQYAILAVAITMIVDQIFDNLVTPRLVGQSLGVHPAAVLVAAFIATNLIGIVGLILAAPVLATLALLVRYTFRKMLDLDPWATLEVKEPVPRESALTRILKRGQTFFKTRFSR